MAKEEIEVVKSGVFRLSFPHLVKPTSIQGSDLRFQATALYAKDDPNLTRLKKIVYAAVIDKYGSKAKIPKKFRYPFLDGDQEDWDGYEGTTFIRLKSKNKPGCVDRGNNLITLDSEIESMLYAGCFCQATITAFVYDMPESKGISFWMRNIQKVRDGEQFSGSTKPADEEFDDLGEDDSAPITTEGSDDGDIDDIM